MNQNILAKETLLQVLNAENLSNIQMTHFMNSVLSGNVNNETIAAFLVGLTMKGETRDEVLGLIQAMRQNMYKLDGYTEALDVCGTGGDQSGTFNISTAVAFVVAAAGGTVIKHGNRAASSKSGSADVLEALGVTIHLSPEQAIQVLETTGIVFLFAPDYHPAMKHVTPIRKALGIPTIFNKVGPLCNPAGVQFQLVGVPNRKDAELLSRVVQKLPHRRVLIVTSDDGLDEVSIAAPSTVIRIEAGKITHSHIRPADFGLATAPLAQLQGGDAHINAGIIQSILKGEHGPGRDIVILNAGCALYAGDVVQSIKAGIKAAAIAIDNGKAYKVLTQLIQETGQYA